MVNTFRASLLSLIVLFIASSGLGQTPTPPTSKPTAPGLIKLTGDDEKRSKQLDEQIDKALKADRWDEAIARAEELLALRTNGQGPKHFETVNAKWRLKTWHMVAAMSKEDRAAYRLANTATEQADTLYGQGKYGPAQQLSEKALEIRRRLFTDFHPETARSFIQVALNLKAQGKYAKAQPLYDKALEIRRGLFPDDHPELAEIYINLAHNLAAQGKYPQAQPLFEKALEIHRRVLTDADPDTAASYHGVATNLKDLGKYAQAQPLFEKALSIRRRLLTDYHVATAVTYNNMALNLNAQGKYAEAQPLLEKTLEVTRRLLTDDHPYTAFAYNNLAGNLHSQRKYAEAQPLFEKALEIRRRLLTDAHPDAANAYNGVALNLDAQGKYSQAQPMYEKALEINRQLLTDNHPITALGYLNVAANLIAQRKYAQAQPLSEKALEITRGLLTDEHPKIAVSYNTLAVNLARQGKYAEAQPLFEKALQIRRRLLTDEHPDTALSYNNLAGNLGAQGKYFEALENWQSAVKSLNSARLRVAFTGLERATTSQSMRPALAAVLARLGQPGEAWQTVEENLGRGLLDELAARADRRLAPAERARLRELNAELEKFDKLVETTPKGLDQAGRAKRFEELKRQRQLASIALGEFQSNLVQEHGARAGQVATLNEVEAALPADAALVAWVDVPPQGPNEADPDGEHWGLAVRSRGIPTWVPIVGSGANGLWTKEDVELASRVRTELRMRPRAGSADLRLLIEKLRRQRLEPLARALGGDALGLLPARRLIVLPSPAMAGIPIETLLAAGDSRTVSYSPSATVFKYLRQQPRPAGNPGLLALGDPVYTRSDSSSDPKLLPTHGLLVNAVLPGANAVNHGLKEGDVLLAYNGMAINKKDDLKVVMDSAKPIPADVWRAGISSHRDLAPGKLGVTFDSRPAPKAIVEQRKLQQVLAAARSGDEDFVALPATRREVEAITLLFNSDNRPGRALLGTDASESELGRLAATNELKQFAFIHLATHGVIDEAIPQRSAVILTQTGLPDPLDQVLNHKPVFDGRLLVREIQRTWDLKAELVTLSACETALGKESGGEGFVGFTQALLMSGARSVCLSLWKVDDTATALLMTRFYQNMLGKRPGLTKPMPKAEALGEAKKWLRLLSMDEAGVAESKLPQASRGDVRRRVDTPVSIHLYEHPHFWAAFVLVGDPD
jgi:tetratricopeptide (TPR) repeat protein